MRDNKLIQLYITNMCNSHCKTCSIWRNKEREELSPYDISKVLKAFPDADYVIGGGEAILHKHIRTILSIFRDGNFNYTLLSNCINILTLKDLVEQYNVPAITISFDGLNHDMIRGVPGNINYVVSFKEWCDKTNVRMKVSYTYSKYNEESFKRDMSFIKEFLGFNEIYFCIAQDMGLLMTAENDENFVASNFGQILECNLITEKDKAHIISMITGDRRKCTSQNNVHTIYSNGNIVRCQSFKSKDILGNIKEMTVKEIKDVLNFVDIKTCEFDSKCNLLCQRRYD